eukprot:TRINITY_DN2490_c0_g2_i1.p1 TRINITY_DN2490_c0_g2~~TRINITY_DN2490_c0_g2_i1.p1  ORF type:complete len:630 (-),score=144.86 TRINITY_DN2490_c0_g2_i1:123-2012(-)
MSDTRRQKLREEASARRRFGNKDDCFELGRLLGQGSQADVYVCTRCNTGAQHAVKRIDTGSLELRKNANRLLTNLGREIKVMRELHHERIVNLIEAFWQGDVCFIVMDLALGGSLHDLLRPGVGLARRGDLGCSEVACRRVTQQLLEGMGYMHSHNVIHRDLKPANVLITDMLGDGGLGLDKINIKIADFGLSRILKDPGGESKLMTRCGTPAFAAPEVMGTSYDMRADFWSLGCIIFTMLCGEYPFTDMPLHILHPELGKVEISPCESWGRASQSARNLVQGLLNSQPSARLDLDGCLRHPWISSSSQDSNTLSPPATAVASKEARTMSRSTSGITSSPRRACWVGLVKVLLHWLRKFEDAAEEVAEKAIEAGESDVCVRFGAVAKLSGWTGSSVDSVTIKLRGFGKLKHGGDAGTKQRKWKLDPDELILAVEQERERESYLGNALVFFTSKCRSIALMGTNASTKNRFIAPVGSQIVGLQFEDSRLVGIHMERVGEGLKGAVEAISGWEGFAVDSISFSLRNGEIRTYGGTGGDIKKDFFLQPDEFIIVAEQGYRDAFLGFSMKFYTSAGNVFKLRGVSAARSLCFAVQAGQQICGLEFEGNQLSKVVTCPEDGDLSDRQQHAIEMN